jgi:DNA-binding IscR family transcriptional regulator
MRMNTRFSVAVHAMTLIALSSIKYGGDHAITSEVMASSINTNPVVIRRITAMLKKSGLVDVKAGVGGAVLKHAPKDITLLDIYNAVKNSEDDTLFEVHKNPNPKCYVGAHILYAIASPLQDAQRAMEDRLAAYTLQEVINPIAEKNHIRLE